MSRRNVSGPPLRLPSGLTVAALLFLLSVAGVVFPDVANAFKNGVGGPPIHQDITREALRGVVFASRTLGPLQFTAPTIEEVVEANRRVDANNLFTPEFHFDDQSLNESSAHVVELKNRIVSRLQRQQALNVVEAAEVRTWIGQALHTIQDFYAHSNWANNSTSINTLIGNGSLLVSRASASAPNCSPDASTLVTARVVSGYFGLRTPTGECAHGILFGSGIHKDAEDRPLYQSARALALAHSIAFLQGDILPSATNEQSVCAVLRAQTCAPASTLVTYSFTGRVTSIPLPGWQTIGFPVAVGSTVRGSFTYAPMTPVSRTFFNNRGEPGYDFANALTNLELTVDGTGRTFRLFVIGEPSVFQQMIQQYVDDDPLRPEFFAVRTQTLLDGNQTVFRVQFDLGTSQALPVTTQLPSQLPPLAFFDLGGRGSVGGDLAGTPVSFIWVMDSLTRQ